MSTTTFQLIASSTTDAVGDYLGAYWPVIIPVIIGISLALAAVRHFRGGFRRKF